MRLAIDAVADGRAAGIVSAGNTGALMAMAKFALKMLPGIDRPAICAALPVCIPRTSNASARCCPTHKGDPPCHESNAV